MDAMTKEWVSHLGAVLPLSYPKAIWIPRVTSGKNKLPDDYVIPWAHNPGPALQGKAARGKRTAKLVQDTHRLRYLYYLKSIKRLDTTANFNEMVKLSQKMHFGGRGYDPLVWPKGWDEKMIACVRKGLSMAASIKLLGLSRPLVMKLYKEIRSFKRDIDMAVSQRQAELIDNITDIAIHGEMENNMLKATMFLLERRYPGEFGAHQSIEITKPTAPMERFLAMQAGEDGDDEE